MNNSWKRTFLLVAALLAVMVGIFILHQQFLEEDSASLTGATTFGILAEGSEDLSWNKTFKGAGLDTPFSMTIDTVGNLYVAGAINYSTQGWNWWIKKFNASGTEDTTGWNKTFDSSSSDHEWAYGITLDRAGDIYVVGLTGDNADDWWIKKFNSSGTEDITNWNKTFNANTTGSDMAHAVAVDQSNDVYVVGTIAINGGDWWIKKFNSSGTEDIVNWNKTFGDPYDDTAWRYVTLDGNNNVYVVGDHNTNSSNEDWWIKKFNSSGTEDTANWNRTFDSGTNSPNPEVPIYATVDSTENIYVVGVYNAVGVRSNDWWIKKFNASGTEDVVNWNKTYDYVTKADFARSAALDAYDNLYVVGYVSEINDSFSNWMIKKFNSSGTENTTSWNLTFNSGSGIPTADVPYSVVSTHDGDIIIAGEFAGNSFASGGDDWWIKKLNGTAQNFPQVNISNPKNGSNLTGNILFNVSIREATIETIFFSFTNSTPFNVTPSNTSGYWNVTIDSSILDEGLRRMTVLALDKAENYNRTEFMEFTIDRTAPVVTVSCTPAQAVEGQTVTCTCSGSDSGSGLRRSPQFGGGGTSESTTATGTGGTSSECSATDYAGNTASGTSSWTLTTTSGGGSSGGGGGGGGGAQGTAAGASLPASAKSEIPSAEESVSQEYYTSIPEIVSYLHLEPTPVESEATPTESEITTPATPSTEEAAPSARELRPVEEQVPGQIPAESRPLHGGEETFSVVFSNTGDKAIKIKPTIEVEKKIVYEERAKEIIREKIVREAARKGIDLTSTELSQEVEQQIIYLHLLEDENIQYLLGKVFTFGGGEKLPAKQKPRWNFLLKIAQFLWDLFHALAKGSTTVTSSAVAEASAADFSFAAAASSSVSGITITKQIVAGKILLPELLDAEELIIPPGGTLVKELRVQRGISSKLKDLTITFTSLDQKVAEKTISKASDVIFGGAVDLDVENNLLDLYYVVPQVEKDQEVSFEVVLTRPGAPFWARVTYLELFGPYHLSSSTPMMLAQQFYYDDKIYQGGYELTLTMLLDNRIIARQTYPVSLG